MPSILVATAAYSGLVPTLDSRLEPTGHSKKGKLPERSGAGNGLSWSEVQEVVATNDLSRFHRYPSVLSEYQRHNARVKAAHGSVQAYIVDELLGWDVRDSASQAESSTVRRRPTEVIRWQECPHARDAHSPREGYFDGEEGQCTVLATPFPYAIPADARHLIVWCKQPILHPCTMHGCASPSAQRLAWRHIQLRGLSGLVPPREALAAIYAGDLLPEVACAVHADPKLEREVRLAIFEAAGPIRKFVERFEPGSESVWFANPPGLQSVEALPHFHLMTRSTEGRSIGARQ